MNATSRGEIILENDRVYGSHEMLGGQPSAGVNAVESVFAELRARYGQNLVTPAYNPQYLVLSHHLGGGVQGAAAAGRVSSLSNVFLGDMCGLP
eukprot:5866164-Pleurochrysis_carterae.AAC.1